MRPAGTSDRWSSGSLSNPCAHLEGLGRRPWRPTISMNRKNVIRTVTAIAVVLLLGWSFFYFSDDTRGYKPVDTSVAVAQIHSGNVKSAQLDDREQQLRLVLKTPLTSVEVTDKAGGKADKS